MLLRSVRIGLLPRRDRPMNSIWNMMRLVEVLIELALDFAQKHMKPEGALVAKVFHGRGYDQLVALFKAHFSVVKPMKPKASRDKSSETFLVGRGLKKVQGTA